MCVCVFARAHARACKYVYASVFMFICIAYTWALTCSRTDGCVLSMSGSSSSEWVALVFC